MYDIGTLHRATSIEDALTALKANPEATLISGGTDVLIKIREGKMDGCALVDISNVKELKGISLSDNGDIVIKSGTVFSAITKNPIIQAHIPMLGEAVDQVGGPQIRNMGTIGGNLCNGVTSADSGATTCTLGATLVLQSLQGVREVPITEWYAGAGKTVCQKDEILVSVNIPKKEYENFYGHYIKYGKRNAMEIATLGAAVNLKLSSDGKTVEDIRIAFGVASPNPMRCPVTEEKIKGMTVSIETAQTLGSLVLTEVNPRTSWRASKEFRLQLVEELSTRAFIEAVARAGGEKLCLK
ncbi:MAG: xanthine dehydrogenase subunit XdhB [Eubacteriales bacterium]